MSFLFYSESIRFEIKCCIGCLKFSVVFHNFMDYGEIFTNIKYTKESYIFYHFIKLKKMINFDYAYEY